MVRIVTAHEARRNLGKLLDMVSNGDSVVVERRGKPTAAIMPMDAYEQWQRQRRQAFFGKLQEMAEQANMSEEEAAELVEEAIRWARSNKPDSEGGSRG